jgi:hypothetical protein
MKEIKQQPTGANTHTRRDFLAKTAVAAAGLAIVSACGSSDRANQSKEIANLSNKGGDTGKLTMKTRNLGSLVVSEIGAGCMSISANYGPPADRPKGRPPIYVRTLLS